MEELQLFGYRTGLDTGVLNNGGILSGQHDGFPGEKVENLNDRNIRTKYCVVDKASGWIQYTSPEKLNISRYALTSCMGISQRNPRHWTLEASNDGIVWNLLDERKNQDFVAGFHTMYFSLPVQAEAYSCYRLHIHEMMAGYTYELAEWQLFESEPESGIKEAPMNSFVYMQERDVCINSDAGAYEYKIFNSMGQCLYRGAHQAKKSFL